jgi:hypothetical protein
MKGNKKIFSKSREDRIKGYKKLFKQQENYYCPSKDIAEDLVEAMEALGYEVSVDQALAYLKSSYAAHDRKYYLRNIR